MNIIAGIDPGVNTGLALWDTQARKLVDLSTGTIIGAMQMLRVCKEQGALSRIVMEDARLRRWYGSKGREALQGAGSIKRDCSIWTEFAEAEGIPLKSVSPQSKGAKLDAEQFAKLTGWTGRTSNHARDAAMLVWGMP
jgi:hypothetical protein